jgi:NAD(P)-dependent dehydrogenase (short-subunit alcohol dehydrogenase family)
MGRIFGRCALVTGAASGIGRATARLFALEGATVIVTDINVEGGRAVAEEIGSRAEFMKLDVRDEEQWASVSSEVAERFDGLDIYATTRSRLLFIAQAKVMRFAATRSIRELS